MEGGIKEVIIRPIKNNEIMLLTDFLYEAIFQKDETNLAPRTIIQEPSLWIYIDEFGTKKEDDCFVAELENKIVGAVWVRCIKAFGHIDDAVPEFAISIYPQYRGKGIGTALMQKMLGHLKLKGYSKTSLAVQKENYAVRMYQKVGFEICGENEQEYIMICNLSNVDNALLYAEKSVKGRGASFQNIMAIAFSSFLLFGIIVVSIINLMVSGTFTWSLIPISISVFVWLVFFPVIKFGIKGVIDSFINISIFLVPFLYVLDCMINHSIEHHVPIFSMGISIAPILIMLFWVAFYLFKKLQARKLLCSAILALLLSPATFLINFFLDITQGQGQIWSSTLSSVNVLIPLAAAIILFAIDFMVRKKMNL